jgi:uncharacterized membrane protein
MIMAISRKFRALVLVCATGAALAMFVSGIARVAAQNAGQILLTPTGKELIRALPPGSAYDAFTSISSLRDGRMWLYQVPLTGFTITMNVDQSAIALNPAGTLATGTIVMPPVTVDGKIVTIFSTAVVTALTLTPTNSATFAPAAATALAANVTLGYVYDKANNQWHRFQ